MLTELKRRIRLLVRRLDFGDPSRRTELDHQLRVGESASRSVDGVSHHS